MVSKKLLWKAWPEGFLAMRAGGWALPARWLFRPGVAHHPQVDGDPAVELARKAGDLLPNVNPKGTATWALLLEDLADAAGVNHSIHGSGFSWESKDGIWTLWCCGEQGLFFEDIDTADPAEALVLARIQTRERAAALEDSK